MNPAIDLIVGDMDTQMAHLREDFEQVVETLDPMWIADMVKTLDKLQVLTAKLRAEMNKKEKSDAAKVG